MNKPDNRTVAQKRREEKREAMREYLEARGYLWQIDKDLDREMTADELPVVKFKTEVRLKLLSKILPDLTEGKSDVNVSGDLTAILANIQRQRSSGSVNPPVD